MKGISRLIINGAFLLLVTVILCARGYAQQKGSFPPATIQSNPEPPLPGDDHWSDKFSIPGVQEYLPSGQIVGYTRTIATFGDKVYVGGFFPIAGGEVVNNIAMWDKDGWHSMDGGTNRRPESYYPYGNPTDDDTPVQTIVVDNTGMVYAAGHFTRVGGITAYRVARWDGKHWHAMGAGLDSTVRALAIGPDGSVYAGGLFTHSGSTTVNHLARWDGKNWQPVGDGIDEEVWALTVVPDGSLYVGGKFDQVDGITVNNVARWDGKNWSALGDGVTGCVPESYNIINNTLFGCDLDVHALTVDGDNLYVGGSFQQTGNKKALRLAKWNMTTQTWSNFFDGFNFGAPRKVWSVTVDGEKVYVGTLQFGKNNPRFLTSDEVALPYWNGTKWDDLDPKGDNGSVGHLVDNGVFSTAKTSNGIFFGGYNGVGFGTIMRWDKTQKMLLPLGGPKANGLDNLVYSIASDQNGNIYAGGDFIFAGGKRVNHIAKWDGEKWSSIGNGVPRRVYAVGVSEDNAVYICEDPDPSNKNVFPYAYEIKKWDGSDWVNIAYVNGTLNGITFNNNAMYVYGGFDKVATNSSDAKSIYGVAEFKDGLWIEVGNENQFIMPDVVSLKFSKNGDLYAAWQWSVPGEKGSGVGVLKGGEDKWQQLGEFNDEYFYNHSVDTYGYPNDMVVTEKGEVYVTGEFHMIDSVKVNNIAVFRDSTWHNVGGGLSYGNLRASGLSLALYGNEVYAGGEFDRVFDSEGTITQANNIAIWDGSNWKALGHGTGYGSGYGYPTKMIISASKVYLADGGLYGSGNLWTAGLNTSFNFAEYSDSSPLSTPKIWPPDDSTGVITNPTLDWQDVLGAQSYNLQVSTASTGGTMAHTQSVVIDTSVATSSFTVPEGRLSPNTAYQWHYQSVYSDSTGDWTPEHRFTTGTGTPIEHIGSGLPQKVTLSQNYPNPFNPSTVIRFELPRATQTKLVIYNVLGQQVAVLVNNERLQTGSHLYRWNASSYASGVYFYRLTAGNRRVVKSMVLIK